MKKYDEIQLTKNKMDLDLILIDEASADRLFPLAKKEGTIQYGYRTWGTRARVFCQTLEHGNSKNEIRQRNRRRW